MEAIKNFYRNYICLNLNEFENLSADLEINKVLFFLALGICAACFVLNYYQSVISLFLKKLIRAEATAENAKTLSDLGLKENKTLKLPYDEAMLRRFVRTNGNAVSGNIAKFLKERIGLRDMILRNGANASAEITFQSGKTDGKALSSHFYVAFAQGPKTAKRLVGIGGEEHCRIFVAGEKAVGNAHRLVRACRAFDIRAAFRIGNGEDDDVAAVGKVKMKLGMIFERGLAVFVGFKLNIGKTVRFFQNVVKKQARAEQSGFGFRALGGFNALLAFGGNPVYIVFDLFFRAKKGNV